MARCKECGKKGLCLKLNARGLCEECAEKAKMAPRSGQIIITKGGINSGNEYVSIGHADETNACQFFVNKLVERGKDIALFKIEHRTPDYTSLVYDEYNDFIRIKITDKVSWISIALSNEDRNQYKDAPLFDSQENKGQRHWRSYFENIDQLQQYLELAENACVSIPLGTVRDVSEKEKAIADYIYDLFIDCGAEPENMFYYTLAHEFEIMYKCGAGNIRFKAYAKKSGGYILMDRDFESTKIKGENNRFLFKELPNLDCLKDELIPLKIARGNEMEEYYTENYNVYLK